MDNITIDKLRKEGLVIFAGAGCSVAAPSSIPGWYALNDAILETLWDRLEEYRITIGFREKILPQIKQYRNDNKFPPDYQAQLMEERVGIKYFELLGAVDADTYNPVQYYSALLAKEGIVKAIVTTNFDQNFERAFEDAAIDFELFFDEDRFKSFSKSDETVPIIKIHGSCTSPYSLIDTRKQRLKGRSAALEKILHDLLIEHHFLFAGFSGEDFDNNKDYLGFWNSAGSAKGFTYLVFPGSEVRKSINELMEHYGEKAASIKVDSAVYLEKLLEKLDVNYKHFSTTIPGATVRQKLIRKAKDLEPMDAMNMLTALTESYGDEISARFLYDKTWKNRLHEDYQGDGISRFLLNYGRSYVVSFQNRMERAESAGVPIVNWSGGELPKGAENYFDNPAQQNMLHVRNTSPENIGLIGLAQTYQSNPVLFKGFPESLIERLQSRPSKTEAADIYYYYSHYAMTYGEFENSVRYLNAAIADMDEEFDEPRLSQLLSRRALIKFRVNADEIINSGEEDARRAKSLAEKYFVPSLLALSNLALATGARVSKDFRTAYDLIRLANNAFWDLRRIPQFAECNVECLKIIFLGLQDSSNDSRELLDRLEYIMNNVNSIYTERINVFEPEFCYMVGFILQQFTDAPKEKYLPWLIDAVSLAEQYGQDRNYEYFKETYKQLNILSDVETAIRNAKDKGKS